MWSRLEARSVLGGRSGRLFPGRRFFTPSAPRLTVGQQAASKAGTRAAAPQDWSSRSVLAVAVATGILGWGAANLQFGDGSKLLGGQVRLDEDDAPRYANMMEMETVSSTQSC